VVQGALASGDPLIDSAWGFVEGSLRVKADKAFVSWQFLAFARARTNESGPTEEMKDGNQP
jgi:hypothetical protein